ncbi:MAG TPA: DUF3703 domain-containing protein [Myxococcaceae bacterium]|nr:DUF3703 domain-containing protein [Myxococcaceae bacterium]
MSPELKRHFEEALDDARSAETGGRWDLAWGALERAHVLSQAYALPHLRVHARMFRIAWRRRAVREVLGQVPRLILAVPGSLLGRAPRGNTGGANVGLFTPMPIAAELEAILARDRAATTR